MAARRVGLDEVRRLQRRTVVGLMTGTSMDGLDVAVCHVEAGARLACSLLAFATVPLPPKLAAELYGDERGGTAGVARWNAQLGRFFADALAEVLADHPADVDLIGTHGQTVYHEHGVTSLQLGEPSMLAERFGCPVVADFRAADIAAGGCGAPLVPYVDYRLLARRERAVLAVNVGGISNIAAVPRLPCGPEAVLGMDCGPGNMVLDQLATYFTRGLQRADIDGRFAALGSVRQDTLRELADHRFFRMKPPKSAGREQFGDAYVRDLLAFYRPAEERDWFDLFATVTELTALGVHEAYRREVADRVAVDEVVVSGGGARNPQLMAALARRFAPLPVVPSDAYGLPIDAKEAMAFAVLASERVDRRPTNMPQITGARRPVLLGKITEV